MRKNNSGFSGDKQKGLHENRQDDLQRAEKDIVGRKGKRLLTAALCLTMGLGCTACGSTAAKNTKSYWSRVHKIMNTALKKQDNTAAGGSGAGSGAASTAAAAKTPLDMPSAFTVSEDGTYSFDDVADAAQYIIYLCDPSAVNDSDDYLYASMPIKDDDSAVYTGRLSDLVQFPYGTYLVKVFAYPGKDAADKEQSAAASAEYTSNGEQSEPEVAYFWDTNEQQLYCELANVDAYTYEAYPDQIVVTCTNTEDAADVVTQTLEGVSPDNTAFTVSGLSKGSTYKIEAEAVSSSENITNQHCGPVTVEEALTLGDRNILSPDYTYEDGMIYLPRLVEAFDPAGGYLCDEDVFGTAGKIETEAPKEEAGGKVYHFEYSISFVSGSGDLHIMDDGTVSVDLIANDPRGASETVTPGSWVANEDGTLALSLSAPQKKE